MRTASKQTFLMSGVLVVALLAGCSADQRYKLGRALFGERALTGAGYGESEPYVEPPPVDPDPEYPDPVNYPADPPYYPPEPDPLPPEPPPYDPRPVVDAPVVSWAYFERVERDYNKGKRARNCRQLRRALKRLDRYISHNGLVPPRHASTVRYPTEQRTPTIGDLARDRTIRLEQGLYDQLCRTGRG